MLYPISQGEELANKGITMILKELKKEIDLSVDDYCQIYQYMLLQGHSVEKEPLMI